MDAPLDLNRLAVRVKTARVRRGWSKEHAAREAKISSITWKRVEDGLPVQDAKLAAIGKALQLPLGGHQPNLLLVTPEEHRAMDQAAHAHPDGGSYTAETLRQIAERNILELQKQAEKEAAAIAAEDPERAARILVDLAWTVTEFRMSLDRTVEALVEHDREQAAQDDDDDPLVAAEDGTHALDPGYYDEAARDIGKLSAGQRRRAEADRAGSPPVDDPDDLEPR